MNSSKKEKLSKAVLNVTTYKEDPENNLPPVAQYETIDITDLLKERGITSICSVNGAWSIGGPYLQGGEEDEFIIEYTATEAELRALCKRICDVLDVAIVNEKQNKALKKLIEDEFSDFIEEHWTPIRNCSETKSYIDELFEKEMNK